MATCVGVWTDSEPFGARWPPGCILLPSNGAAAHCPLLLLIERLPISGGPAGGEVERSASECHEWTIAPSIPTDKIMHYCTQKHLAAKGVRSKKNQEMPPG